MKPISTKDITHFHVFREVKDIGMSVHFQNLKGTSTLIIKLYTRLISRLTLVRDIDKISHSKVWLMAVLVYLLTLILLNFLKVLLYKFNHIISLLSKLLSFFT